MGILAVNLNYRHPEVGSGLEVVSRPAHRSLFWALGSRAKLIAYNHLQDKKVE
jgi:hypothetical protein